MNQDALGDTILVVDDSPDTLGLINDTLEQAGFNVLVALEGRQALTISRRIRPDMVLLDAVMPTMDGFATCRELKKLPELASIPVIFLTGLTEKDKVVEGLEAGGVDYLTKPIDPNELLARMKVHLSNARLTSSAYRALDSTGHHLCSVRDDGHLAWATPQTHALLARAKLDDECSRATLAVQLRRWLANAPRPNARLNFEGLEQPLAVLFLNALPDGEALLQVLAGPRPDPQGLLRERLALTAREAEVLLWISNGKTNREIGEILVMSPRTVNKHLEVIFPKLGVENRTAAARIALRVLDGA